LVEGDTRNTLSPNPAGAAPGRGGYGPDGVAAAKIPGMQNLPEHVRGSATCGATAEPWLVSITPQLRQRQV